MWGTPPETPEASRGLQRARCVVGALSLWDPPRVSRPTRPRESRPRTVDPLDLDPRDDAQLPALPDDDDLDLDQLTYDRVSTVLGSVERSGNWQVADRIRARSILGSLKLDFRAAELPPDGMIEVSCEVAFGEVELIVPEGAEVEMEGVMAIVGEVKQRTSRRKVRPFLRRVLTGDEPEDETRLPGRGLLFVVTGRAILGSITVTSRSD